MKDVKKDLKEVVKTLKQLARQVEQMTKGLERSEKTRTTQLSKAKAKTSPKLLSKKTAKKRSNVSAAEIILDLITRSKNGINNVALEKKTGFNNQKIRDNIYRLKKRGKIKTVERGVHLAI